MVCNKNWNSYLHVITNLGVQPRVNVQNIKHRFSYMYFVQFSSKLYLTGSMIHGAK